MTDRPTVRMVYSEIFSTVMGVFDDSGWSYSPVEGREVVRAGFEAHHARVDLHVQAFERLAAVSVVAESNRSTNDPARRDRLAELAMRANQALTVGNFELDWDAGRLLFRTTNLFATPQGDPDIIRGMVHNTVGEMDRIAPVEAAVFSSEGPALASLDIAALLGRADLLPEVPAPGAEGNS